MYFTVPMKVLYADDNYLLFYACYYGELNSTCPRQAVEVTLVGRSREIDPDLEQSIYANLYDVCLQPSLMVRTEFEGKLLNSFYIVSVLSCNVVLNSLIHVVSVCL